MARRILGDLLVRTGPGAAMALFTESLTRSSRKADPNNCRAARDLTASLDRVGWLLVRSDPGAALAHFSESLARRRSLHEADPTDSDVLQLLAAACEAVADQIEDVQEAAQPVAEARELQQREDPA